MMPKDLIENYEVYYTIYDFTCTVNKELEEKNEVVDQSPSDLITFYQINQAGFLKEYI